MEDSSSDDCSNINFLPLKKLTCSSTHRPLPSSLYQDRFYSTYLLYKDSTRFTANCLCSRRNNYSGSLSELWTKITLRLGTSAQCTSLGNLSRQVIVESHNNYSDRNSSGSVDTVDNETDSLPGYLNTRAETARMRRTLDDMEVNDLIEKESGIDRLQAMYALGKDWMFVQEETRTLTTMFYRSVLLGFLINVVQAAQVDDKNKKSSTSKALKKMGKGSLTDSRRVMKEAVKNTVRLGGFAASLIYLSQSIAAYRNVSSVWEYAISGCVAMAIVGVGKPPKTFGTFVLAGAIFGCFGGSMICSMMSSAGISQEQQTLKRIRDRLAADKQNLEQEQGSLL